MALLETGRIAGAGASTSATGVLAVAGAGLVLLGLLSLVGTAAASRRSAGAWVLGAASGAAAGLILLLGDALDLDDWTLAVAVVALAACTVGAAAWVWVRGQQVGPVDRRALRRSDQAA